MNTRHFAGDDWHDPVGLSRALEDAGLGGLTDELLARAAMQRPHGELENWRRAIAELPNIAASDYDFASPAVRIGAASDCDDATRAKLKELLLQLHPWRKGPFNLFGVEVDAEWRSDMKWARLAAHADLHNARVLDVGCGSGYYLWRMLGGGAKLALGIDPSQLFCAQFAAVKKYCADANAFVLPLKCEEMPAAADISGGFDAVFSMGILSHRRQPLSHLQEVLSFARPGGAVVVETLVLDTQENRVFTPPGRYAKMRNVHCIPSPSALQEWLREAGATDVRVVDISRTGVTEQRRTEWMRFQSLADYLHADDSRKTVEGHPRPVRGVVVCRKPQRAFPAW